MRENWPQEWKNSRIGDLAKVVSGGTPSRTVPEYWQHADIPWVTPTDITTTQGRFISATRECITEIGLHSCGATLLPPGSLLMTSRATVGEIRIAGCAVCTNQGFKSLVPAEGVSEQFLFYQLAANKDKYRRLGIGSTFLEVNKRDTEGLELLIAPEGEQRRIAEILSTVDEAIEQTEALIAKYQQIKSGLMHDLFTRGLTPDGHLRPTRTEAPHLYKQSPLGWIPKEWSDQSLFEAAANNPKSFVIGPFGSDLLSSDYRTTGVPVVFVRDVKANKFEWNSRVYIGSAKAAQLRAHEVRPGDIVCTKMGTPPGISCKYPEWMQSGIITADIIRIQPNLKSYNGDWLSAAINCAACQSQIQAIMAGVTRSKLTLRDFRRLRLSVPKIAEQELLAERLSCLKTLDSVETNKLCKLNQLKSGLMQDLLTGRVRVPELTTA